MGEMASGGLVGFSTGFCSSKSNDGAESLVVNVYIVVSIPRLQEFLIQLCKSSLSMSYICVYYVNHL